MTDPEYPKQMRFVDGSDVTVMGPPDEGGYSPALFAHGRYGLPHNLNLSPLPSPDDEVEVVVKMTRKQRDTLASWSDTMNAEAVSPTIRACRAHRDAEAAPAEEDG